MIVKSRDSIEPISNVWVQVKDAKTGALLEERREHNVLTNVGRAWLRNLISTKLYPSPLPSNGYVEGAAYVYTSEKPGFMGFGVGGSFSSAPYYSSQDELVTVTELEDYVKVDSTNYLKEVVAQTSAEGSFPTAYSVIFETEIPESEISFAGSTSKSGNVVGTSVPVSEVGLYLTGADKTQTPAHADNNTRMIAYNIFSPITITTAVVIRVEWEFRF